MRKRMLNAFQGLIEMAKYVARQGDCTPENAEAIVARIVDPHAEDRFDLNNLLPAGLGTQFFTRFVHSIERQPADEDIPLDWLLTGGHLCSEFWNNEMHFIYN